MGGMRGNMKTPINWKRKRKLAGLTALIAAAALGLTACGDGSPDGRNAESAGNSGTGVEEDRKSVV